MTAGVSLPVCTLPVTVSMGKHVNIHHIQNSSIQSTLYSILLLIRVVWLCKEALYPDTIWATPTTLGSGLVLFLSLGASFWANITGV